MLNDRPRRHPVGDHEARPDVDLTVDTTADAGGPTVDPPTTATSPPAAAEPDPSEPVGDRPEPGLLANAGALLASRLISAALGWAGTVLIARSLDLAEFGRFTLVFTVLGLMSVVTDMGLGRLAVRGMLGQSGVPDGDFAGTYIVLRTVMGGVGYLLALAVVWVLGYPAEVVAATAVAGVVVLVATPSAALDAVFQSRMRMGTVSTAQVVGLSGQFALTAAIAAGGGTLLLFTLPAVLCELIIIVWKTSVARRVMVIRLHVDVALWRGLLREALPLTIGFGLATVYYKIDGLMLSRLDTFESVGIYGVSYKFIDVLHYASIAVTTPLLTLLVRAWPDDLPAFRDTLRRGALLLALLGGVALTGLLGFARPLTTLLYGEQYAVGEHATRVLAVSQVLTLLVTLALTGLVAMGRHRQYPWVMLAGLLLNVGLNLVLVPRYSYEGAATATLVTETVVLVVILVLFVRIAPIGRMRLGRMAAALPALAAGLGAGMLLDQVVGLPWFLAAVVATVVYLAATVVLGLWGAAGLPAPWARGRRRDRAPTPTSGGTPP